MSFQKSFQISFRTLALATLLLPATSFAQWSKSPDYNQPIGNGPEDQIQAKLAPRADGGFYASWFDNSGDGGYDVRLQRLDVKGRAQWGHNGLVIADRKLSFTTDYGIDVDDGGNALLAFHDKSLVDGKTHIQISKIDANGAPLWGDASGLITLPSGYPNDAASPRLVATPDGGAVVAWTVNFNALGQGAVVLQRVDANGNLQWGADNVRLAPPTGGSFILADLRAAGDGGYIVSWTAQLSRFVRQFWTQKYDANGQPLWGSEPRKLWDDNASGAIPPGVFPSFASDGHGGAAYCWEYTFGVSSRRIRVQHVRADGTEAFPHNGAAVSTDNVNNRIDCSVHFDKDGGDTYVVWRERTPGNSFSQTGVYAQRFDVTGARQWGDNGNVIMPLDPIAKSSLTMVPMPNGFVAAWAVETYPLPMPVYSVYVTRDGNYGWSRGIVALKTSPSPTGYMSGAASSDGYATFAWSDVSALGDVDVVVQNIGRDGVLGKKEPGNPK